MLHKKWSVFSDLNSQSIWGDSIKYKLQNSIKNSKQYVQNLQLYKSLKVHKGCVNTISWNEKGQYILSGSDDQSIVITNPYNSKVVAQYKTAHRANIFSAKFLPQSGDRGIISCSGDGIVLYTELTNPQLQNNEFNDANLNYFNCHSSGTTYEILTVPTEPNSFMSCGEDGTVRLFDLRKLQGCRKTCCKDNILILTPSAITDMTLSPISQNYIAVGSSDSQIRIFDRRYLSLIDFTVPGAPTDKHTKPVKVFTIPSIEKRPFRVTSVNYSADETELLVSYSSDHLYLFDITKEGIDYKVLSDKTKRGAKSKNLDSPPPVRRLRLRGDWSDTGPDARPEREMASRPSSGQARPQLQATIMHRMTEVLSRMIADPRTRIGLNANANSLSFENDIITDNLENEDLDLRNERSEITTEDNLENPQPGPSNSAASSNHNRNPSTSRASSLSKLCKRAQHSSSSDDEEESENDQKDEQNDLTIIEDTTPRNFDYVKQKFIGHRNARTVIKEATFWGDDYIMSGSDCGHIFTWERKTGKLCMLIEADQHVVNCLQPHPSLPFLATSGIDYDVKVWGPMDSDTNLFDEEKAKDIMERNAVMLEETKDTITVPAAFMIRMLACMHSLRHRRGRFPYN